MEKTIYINAITGKQIASFEGKSRRGYTHYIDIEGNFYEISKMVYNEQEYCNIIFITPSTKPYGLSNVNYNVGESE